jgi:uncharacterized repeat protein (TIGR01451 family)
MFRTARFLACPIGAGELAEHFDFGWHAPAILTDAFGASILRSASTVCWRAKGTELVLTNTGNATQNDNAGDELTDVLPSGLTLVCASATSGTATATIGTNTVTWNGSIAAGASVTITINATIDSDAAGSTITNQGTFAFDANVDNTNESNGVTDDPSVGGASDSTSFVVAGAALDVVTKSVSGTFSVGGTVTYTIVINNTGDTNAPDNAGDELTDVLPAQLTLVSASATSGAAVATIATNTVTWNGAIPAGGSVTITITATIDAGTEGQTVTNQATHLYDADNNGSNETTVLSDNPSTGTAGDPTTFVVAAAALAGVPTVSTWGLIALAMGLGIIAAWKAARG